jgi:hypothetical protein
VEASVVRIEQSFREVKANSGVVSTVPAMQDLWRGPAPRAFPLQRMGAVFRGQLRENNRYAIPDGGQHGGRAVAGSPSHPAPGNATAHLAQAVQAGNRLAPGQLWFSPVEGPVGNRSRREVALHPPQGNVQLLGMGPSPRYAYGASSGRAGLCSDRSP